MPTDNELLAAYNRTGLNRTGYSFEKAMQCELTKKCLVRMALNAQNHSNKKAVTSSKQYSPAITQQTYWWQKI